MKNKTIKILGTLFITIILLLIGKNVSNAAYAYISPVDNNQRTVTVGDSVSIKAYGSAMAWNLKASGTGISGGSLVDGNLSEKKNKDFIQTYTLDTSKAGTYTLYLKGDITDANGNNTDINDSVTIVVNEKSSSNSSSSSNNNSNNNSNSNSNSNSNTTKEPSFTTTNDTVYSTGSVNVRKSYSTDSSIIGSLSEGEEVKREATGDNGWSKVKYNGSTGYVKTSLLTTEKSEEKNTDKSLKSLKVSPEGLNPEFNSDTTIYSLKIGADVKKVDVDAVATSDKAKVTITGNEDIEKDATIKITVTAEDGTERTYTINVTKETGKEITLKSLDVKGYSLSPEFKANVYTYKISLSDPNVSKLDLSAIAESEDAEVTITGNENFKNGQNVVTIVVKPKEGDGETTYKIYVNKTASALAATENKTEKSKVPLYVGIGIIILLIALIVIVIIRNRRNAEYYDEDEDEYDDGNGNGLYGYTSKNNKEFDDEKTTVFKTVEQSDENKLDKVKGNDEDFNYNPYAKKDVYGDFNTEKPVKPVENKDEDLFGTINGIDESYKYIDNKDDDLSEAMNKYKEQEKQEINTEQQNNNKETFSGVNSFDYNSYLENSYGFDEDRSKRSRGKHF